MGRSEEFSYYYGVEAEQYSFYRVPRLLIKDERFRGLSSDAKLLYGLMLDRMSLSMKNGWLDEENRVYICYTLDAIMDDLGCAKEKCTKVLAELDSKKGIGLIEKKRRGLGKPDIIYVKNFATIEAGNETETDEDKDEESIGNTDSSPEVRKSNFKKFEKQTSRSSKIELQEVRKSNLQEFGNQTSRGSEIELAEVRESNPNYTNINYTDMSYINPIYPSDSIEITQGRGDGMDYDSAYVEMIRENIAYVQKLKELDVNDRNIYCALYALICEIVCVPRKSIQINGTEYPYELVQSRFLQLNTSHLDYVMDSLKKTSTKIINIRAYLITALFNAPITMKTMIEQEVRHDMFGGGWEEKGIR